MARQEDGRCVGGMTHKHYCSKVCKAACCRKRPPFVTPDHCPKLGPDNLCSIYDVRIGFTFEGTTKMGQVVPCACLPIKEALEMFPDELKASCCYWDESLLRSCCKA